MANARETLPIDVFEALIDRCGADVERFPAPLREPARALLDASPAARELLAEAAQLDAALGAALDAPPPPPGLGARIEARVPAAPVRDAWLEWLAAAPWRGAALACLPLALGIGIGVQFATAVDIGAAPQQELAAFADAGTFAAFGAAFGDAP